jgi:hypothetical protein
MISFVRGGIMHNLISYNQLASWNHINLDKTIDKFIEETEIINDYYQCLIECSDNQAECKRVCREILSS